MNLSNISFEINIFDDSEILKSQVQKDSLHEYILRENHSVISYKKIFTSSSGDKKNGYDFRDSCKDYEKTIIVGTIIIRLKKSEN